MTRLFLEGNLKQAKTLRLEGEKAHYISKVLRCKIHDILIVTDNSGVAYFARISALTKKETSLEIIGPLCQDNESPLDIILLQGLLKGDKMDLVIQKATELGVAQIIPVITERSQLRETRKLQRWQKLAGEAARQCGRNRIPLIHVPDDFETVSAAQQHLKGLICWEKAGPPFSAALDKLRGERKIVLCIGPEGGFSEKEVMASQDRGLYVASLGKRILRAETAAITAIALTQFVMGDLSGRE